MFKRFLDFLDRVVVVSQFAREVLLKCREIKVAVSAEIENDGLFLAFLLRGFGFVNRGRDSVRRLRRDDDALGARERERCVEALELMVASWPRLLPRGAAD